MNNTIINTEINNDTRQDNVKLCISADTYLEGVFYNLCAQDERKVRIYYEWQNNKNRYIHQTAIIAHDFPHYSIHDQEHSRTIIETIEMFLGRWRIERLGIGNAWLLLNAAYGHDIGMVIQHQEMLELWRDDKDFKKYLDHLCNNPESDMQEALQYCRQLHNVLNNKEQLSGIDDSGNVFKIYELTNDWPVIIRKNVMMITADYIRGHHPERSKKFFENLSKTIGIEIAENRLYNLLGQVVYAHGCDLDYIFKELPKETNGFGNEKIYPQFIALLLRLGDLLDMDNNRFDIMLLQHFGALPEISANHLQKHLSISHFLVTEREIQAKAKVTKMEVGKVVDQWFQLIKNEVTNITSNWNRVAPEEMNGCTFNQCTLEIYFNGQKYESFGKTRFEVDNKRFMNILIGDRLYEEQLVFLREYIQNALDATKLMIWLKWQRQENTHIFRLDEYGEINQSLSGLNYQILEDYAIKIKLELLKENSEEETSTKFQFFPEKVRIHIIDFGVGMDQECMKALAIIGTGWSGRKKYLEEIGKMPAWLQPTGSFGVGIQSGFMMADNIRIITHGMNEPHGLDIYLKSPRKTGKIDYMFIQNDKVGTEIILDIDLINFLSKLQHSLPRNSKSVNTKTGVFAYDAIIKDATEDLAEYIQELIPNSIIPIEVSVRESSERYKKGKNVYSDIRTFLTSKHRKETRRNDKYNVDYQLSGQLKDVYFWMRDEQVFIYMNNLFSQISSIEKCEDGFCYKGVKVKHKDNTDMEDGNLISRYLPLKMDIMGMKASECLLISRNYFTKNVQRKFKEWARKCFEIYVAAVAAYIKEDRGISTTGQLESSAYLLLAGALYLGRNKDTEYLCSRNTFDKNFEMKIVKKEGKKYGLIYGDIAFDILYKCFALRESLIVWQIDETSKDYDEEISIDFVSAMQEDEEGEDEEDDDEETEKDGKDEEKNNIDKKESKENVRERAERYLREMLETDKQNRNYIITDDILVNLLEEFISKGKKRTLLRVENMDKRDVLLSVYDPEYHFEGEKQKDEKRSLKKILTEAIRKKYYYISVNEECDSKYSALYVTEAPLKTDLTEEYLQNHRVILLPFNIDFYAKMRSLFSENVIRENGLSEDKIDNRESIQREEYFWKMLTSDKTWERAIQWTMRYSINCSGFSQRDIITEQYKNLCEEIYHVYVEI